jgi:creatinine amidohydrolase
MLATPYALDGLSWPEVQELLTRDARLLFPVGALEQHGPHLPLGTSTLIAERLAADASAELGILLAPTLSYGVGVPGRRGYAGTTSFRRKTLHRAVNELLAGWEDHGVKEFILITAHRYEPHVDALLMAMTASSRTTVIDLYQIEVGDLLEGPPEAEHGGELETSLLLHLDPDRVRRAEIEDFVHGAGTAYRTYMRGRMPTPPSGSRGAVGRASLATADKGRRIYARYRAGLRAALERRDS